MLFLRNLLSKSRATSSKRRTRAPHAFVPAFESLESRRMLAVTAVFTPATGVLSVYGDSSANAIDVSRNVAGGLLVNGGAVAVVGGLPTVANTSLIQMFGLSGDDTLSLNQTNGA